MHTRPIFGVFFSRPVSLPACFILLLSTISALPARLVSAQTRTLEPNKPIERELAGGGSHQYQIGLIAGRFLRVIVEQRGIDVVVTLFSPDGKQLLEVDSPNGTEGEESLGWVTEAVGVYRLEVRSLEKDAAAGRYTVKLTEFRAATADDPAALAREQQLRQANLWDAEAAGLIQTGKVEQAFSLMERALAMREKALGAQHPDVATTIKDIADWRKKRGDYDLAETLYNRALAIREKALGAEHPNVAVTLAALADVYFFKSDLNRAETLYNRALAIVEKTLGPDHPNAALTLNNLASLYTQRGDYAKAEPLQQRVLAMLEKYLGPENPSVATALNNLATINENIGNYPKAETLLQRALAMREKTLGAEHKDVAGTLNNLAYLYDATGEYAKSEKFYQRALTILEKQLGANHPDVATAVSNFGSLHQKKGDYARAEELFQSALTAREKALGANHPDVALSLGNLSGLFQDRGDYVKAERLQRRALEILERALGAEHPDTARTLNNLAAIYNDKGDYAQAETLHQRALAIREKALGTEHPSVATSLNNLAFLYNDKKQFDKAVPLLKRALAIWEKTLGPNHPDVALALNNLAAIYERTGDFAAALPLHQRALTLREQVFGAQHPTVANSLNNLAVFYFNKGDVAAAEPFAARALEIWESALGPDHPTVINALTNLMSICDRKGDYARAVAYAVRAAEVSERNVALNLVAGSERQRLAYLTTYARDFDRYITLHTRHAPTDARARDLAVVTILRAKGRVLDATADSLTALRRRAAPEDQSLLDELRDANNQLAQFALDSARRIAPEQRRRIKELEARKERLESEVSRRNAEFRAQSQSITLAAVKAAIPADAALVEFFVYRPFDPQAKTDERYGSPRYVAYVVRRQGETSWVELGEQAAIDATVAKLRAALRDKRRTDVKQLARAADEKVMRPVRRLLGQTQRVFLAPDGALNLLPFAALADETGRYLIERYSFSCLTSGRDLLRLEVKQPNQQTALVVANPDFGEAAKSGEAQERILKYRPAKTFTGEAATLSEFYFPPLLGTAGEASALKAMMADAQVLTQAQATEATLKQIRSPRILHIATHGFFLDDRSISTGERLLQHSVNQRPENPLLRSGLALAGANTQNGGKGEDGILTAQEAAGLDLWGTKLVVLSACDTGVGEIRTGEGVYGLRRALVLAGSETQVMSLWPVSDKGTRDLMIGYYKRLLADEGRTEALRRSQLELLASKIYSHPYYWASFIQSGEWANLEGQR